MKAAIGDRLIVDGHVIGAALRDGEIIEVHGSHGSPPYVVRWEDGHQSLVYPGPDAHVQHFAPHASRAR